VKPTPPVQRRKAGRGHRYVDADGRRVPGVTTILNDGLPKPALIAWAANTTAEYALDNWDELATLSPSKRLRDLQRSRFASRDAAAKRGTEVHRLAEQLVSGSEVEVPDELAGHVEAYRDFLDAWQVQPVLVEAMAVSYEHGYAGTLDLIADLTTEHGIERWLLDIKTTQSGVFPETALQLAAYRYGDELPEVDRCGVVHVTAEGAALVPVEAGRAEHRYFLYCQQVAEFGEIGRDLVGEPLDPPRREAA
jgi:hypothetical protein